MDRSGDQVQRCGSGISPPVGHPSLAVGRALGRVNVERAMAIGVFVAFGTLWFAVSLLLSHIGDWSTLARHYPNMVLPTLRTFYMSSGYVGAVSYRSCLVLRVCETGLRLSVLLPFRVGHPPIFIPWEEFYNISENRSWFNSFMHAELGRPVVGTVGLPLGIRQYMPSKGQAR
jgi:hypothetical protein